MRGRPSRLNGLPVAADDDDADDKDAVIMADFNDLADEADVPDAASCVVSATCLAHISMELSWR
jgi:hypothetical protein